MASMQLVNRRRREPAPWQVDLESSVREQLYGGRAEISATPLSGDAPTRVGARYRLLDALGAGGTAEVYRARDERLQRYVAVKVIAEGLAHDPASVRRLRREAELGARLAHRNVAAILDAGSRPREYLVMELVDGPTLATLPTVSVDVVLQVCDALEHAHSRGVVHGDVGPRNIVVGRRDGTAKLIDFGHAIEGFGIDPDLDALGALASGLPGDPGRPASIADLRESLLAMRSARPRAA